MNFYQNVAFCRLTRPPYRASAATAWLEWHADAQAQITKLRNSNMSDVQRVKIAILDSGIELSQDNEDLYNIEPKIQYKSWIDQDTEWKDDAGHGTHLAILVRKIAPNAIVHVGRVFKKKPNKGSAANVAQVKILENNKYSYANSC